MKKWMVGFCWFLVCLSVKSQTNYPLREIVLKTDTLSFSNQRDIVRYKGENYFSFFFSKPDEVCEINIFPAPTGKIKDVDLVKSAEFVQLDTLLFLNAEYYRTKIRFINLQKSQFLDLVFKVTFEDSLLKPVYQEIKLLPFTKTLANFYPTTDELFIGEEKIFELVSNSRNNIRVTNDWTSGQDIDYRINEHNGQLRVHLMPNVLGNKTVAVKLQTYQPYLNDKKEVVYDLPPIVKQFKVKSSRLAFLNVDQKEVTYDEAARKTGIELQIDGHRQLQLNKTYRLEDQEQPGGPLIAELFVKNFLANDRVLCIFRPFNLHRQTEGYLYIKDGDEPKFITNLGITPKTDIQSIQVMHDGQPWTSSLNVNPGETIDVKIEGEGLHKARFHWEDVLDITSDTLVRNENVCYFRLKVPMTINKRKITLFNNGVNTGMVLNVAEYQLPRKLEFVTLNYGNGAKSITSLSPVVIQRKTVKDVIIGFNTAKIDDNSRLYGKQYIDIDVRLLGKSNELIEVRAIKNLVVCPDGNSPRAAFYKDKASVNSDLSLNTYLSNKTYNLNDFSKIQLEIKHQPEKYSEPAYTKQIDLVIQRPFIFDYDVSFPAGLMIQNIGQSKAEKENFKKYEESLKAYNAEFGIYLEKLKQWDPNSTTAKPTFTKTEPTKPTKAAFTDNLGGVSLALILQFSFPDGERVGKSKPYRFGAGFLAINAFNFSETAKRDLAAVALASVYPIRPGKLFSLPIHFGFGYKFQDEIPFVMLSPGIGIKF